jgi:undecaprenyl-diphosphatase
MKVITSFGSWKILTILSIVVLLFSYKKTKYFFYSQSLVIILILSSLIDNIIKLIFQRVRPDILRMVTESSYSYPSAHAMSSICFYGFIIYCVSVLMKSKWKYVINAILGCLIFSIGISRIYLGIHYASDVLAGFSLGFILLVLSIYEFKKIKIDR